MPGLLRGGQARLFVEASFATCRRLALTTCHMSLRLRLHADGIDDLSVPHDIKGSAVIIWLSAGDLRAVAREKLRPLCNV